MKIQMFRKYIFLRCRTMNNGFLVSTDNINNNNPGSRVIVRILRIEMSYTGIIKDLFPEDTSSFVKDLIAISQWKCQLKRFHSVAHVTIYCAIRATILCYNVKRQVWLGFSFVFINRTSGNTIQKNGSIADFFHVGVNYNEATNNIVSFTSSSQYSILMIFFFFKQVLTSFPLYNYGFRT